MVPKITLVGGGIAGLSSAIALKQKGFQVTVFESAHEIKPVGSGIIIANNAMQVFRKLGIEKKIEEVGHKVSEMLIADEKLNPLSRMDLTKYEAKYQVCSIAIHRAELQKILAEEAGYENIILSKRLLRIEQNENITLEFEDKTIEKCNILLAADGIKSVIRNQLFEKSEIRNTEQVCWRGVVELDLPEKMNNTISEVWGKGKRFGFVKISPGKIYWFAVLNVQLLKEGETNIQNYYNEFHELINNIITTTPKENIIYTPLTDLKPISKWYNKNVCLLGDAAHASTPNMGQGACQAVEDAYTLAQLFAMNKPTDEIFKTFESLRIKRAHAIVNHSWELGKTGHGDSLLGVWLRNAYMKAVGESSIDRALEKIFDIGCLTLNQSGLK